MEPPSTQAWWKISADISAIKDYAIQQGLLVKATSDLSDETVTNVSVTLTPSLFPRELFDLACSIAADLNSLVDAVSRDEKFLENALQGVVQHDDFTRRLFQLYQEVKDINVQTCVLGLTRSDYMVDYASSGAPGGELRLRQIEINTIASSFCALTQDRVQNLQQYVQSRYCKQEDQAKIPPNSCLNSVTDGIATAWKEYPGKRSEEKKCFVLFVVQPNERNIYDQRPLEYDLWTRHHIPVVRKTLTELSQEAYLGPDRELLLKSGEEIAVVYYRAGYTPKNYPTDKEWEARRIMEHSRASSCPSLAYQLVGTKKMQQVLAKEGMVERFITDVSAAAKIRSTFAGLYSLELGKEGDRVVEMALREPERFVAKPQREGGGNNYYGEQVKTLLQEIGSTSEREAYILMERVNPPAQFGCILHSGAVTAEPLPLISELGVFGIFVRKGDKILVNKEGGYILRTKPGHVSEGGVAMGAGSLDSPNLISGTDFIKAVCKV